MIRTAAASILIALAAAAPAERYVPSSGWSREDQVKFFEGWFGRHLRAMKEPVLSAPGSRNGYRRRFRMLVLPTFHHSYAIRVDERQDGRAEVRAVRLDGKGGYSPGKILQQERYVADESAVRGLQDAVAAVRLARLPHDIRFVKRDDVILICADGVRFVFEVVDRSGSHFVTAGCDMPADLWALVDAADAFRRSVGSDLQKYR